MKSRKSKSKVRIPVEKGGLPGYQVTRLPGYSLKKA